MSFCIFSYYNSAGRDRCRHLVGRGQGATMHKTALPLLITSPPYNKDFFWPKVSIVPRLRNLVLSCHPLVRKFLLFPIACGKDARFHGSSWSMFNLLFANYSSFSEATLNAVLFLKPVVSFLTYITLLTPTTPTA